MERARKWGEGMWLSRCAGQEKEEAANAVTPRDAVNTPKKEKPLKEPGSEKKPARGVSSPRGCGSADLDEVPAPIIAEATVFECVHSYMEQARSSGTLETVTQRTVYEVSGFRLRRGDLTGAVFGQAHPWRLPDHR